jgi:hypothetical protein
LQALLLDETASSSFWCDGWQTGRHSPNARQFLAWQTIQEEHTSGQLWLDDVQQRQLGGT